MKINEIIKLLNRARLYVVEANQTAETRHDDMDGEYYMDGVQYEIMQETNELIKDIDKALEDLKP